MWAHLLGLDNGSGMWYLFWSGIGSDIGELTLLVAAWSFIRKSNCHVHGCWRVGRHATGDATVCRKHHPEGGYRD